MSEHSELSAVHPQSSPKNFQAVLLDIQIVLMRGASLEVAGPEIVSAGNAKRFHAMPTLGLRRRVALTTVLPRVVVW